ncbi:MAG: DUF1015 domain-containing protein [Treponema sp.]|nr:DUF1015 domain-containing protein [Treponema sp.]
MKNIEEFGLRIPEILLPAEIDLSTWSVIACDQYTQDKDYWKKAEETAGSKPSTLNLILPEVYLNSPDKPERIKKIRKTMGDYLQNGVFAPAKKCLVYLERKTAFGRTRKGLVAQIDLETYEWKPFSKANIRATEATIVDRIPPRKEIRKGAQLELPHIMLLVNDKDGLLVEGSGELVKKNAPLYNGDLMNNGGSITGWEISSEADIAKVTEAINKIAEKNTAADGSVFLFAVGDGNHSLATAKAVWDEYKEELKAKGASEEELLNCPVRYALIEIVNIYDKGLTFEPIHRVIFNIDSEALIKQLAEKLGGTISEVTGKAELEAAVKNSWADFGFDFVKDGVQKYILLKTGIKELAVARLQPEIDEFLKTAPAGHVCKDGVCQTVKPEIDYIHGTEEVLKLGEQQNATGILLPPIAKDSFFETINGRGPLPRKSFSMGEADEKRFYLECRKLFS